jgi:hypothetical protein
MPAPRFRSIFEAGRTHATASIGAILGNAVNRVFQSAIVTIVVYAASLGFAIAALIFLYTLADRLLIRSMSGVQAAGVMIGVNLLLMIFFVVGRKIFQKR